jgi:hypothetical protein
MQEAILYAYDLTTVPSLLPAFANKRDLIVVDEVPLPHSPPVATFCLHVSPPAACSIYYAGAVQLRTQLPWCAVVRCGVQQSSASTKLV